MNAIDYKQLTDSLETAMKSFEVITAQAFETLKKEDPQTAEKLMADYNKVKSAKNHSDITDLINKYANFSSK